MEKERIENLIFCYEKELQELQHRYLERLKELLKELESYKVNGEL